MISSKIIKSLGDGELKVILLSPCFVAGGREAAEKKYVFFYRILPFCIKFTLFAWRANQWGTDAITKSNFVIRLQVSLITCIIHETKIYDEL